MKLTGKVALVTGASAGIGRASALALAHEGADVALNYLGYDEQAHATAKAIGELGRRTLLFPVDVADQNAVEAMVKEIVDQWGRIDVLVTSAVFSHEELFWKGDLAGFRKTLDVTLWGTFHALRAVTNHLIKQGQGGSLILIGSPHAEIAFPTCIAYNMAKAGIDQMAKTAATELIPYRIRVNVVHPGWTDTPGERKFFSEEMLAKAGEILPWQRLARPEEIARGVVFLADPDSEYVTGSTLTIDGGLKLPWWSKRAQGGF